ncbi:MAG TPA: hypothetical protein DCL61_15135 [Cyanobacteria bacterium UBA12227]|nr:hypothetical protein [Cyanobacteria bacterium UBA12227]HAX86002.1 hypothetical protein [Cyanobacteria bacterium UBA11370]HBY78883.1 hypothetical protein [Cyanobacteria bacterium UBA11148]
MKRHPYLLSVISACLLTVVSVPKGSSQAADVTPEEPTSTYPPEVVQIYVDNCVMRGGAEIRPFCACTIEKIQETYTLQEFLEIGQNLQAGKKAPRNFDQIITTCLEDL